MRSFFYIAAAVASVAAITDTEIMNYALTLEHLENAFYSGGMAKYDAASFEAAGFPDWVRGRFVQIASHEAQHVQFLETALGPNATQACNYSFPDTDPKSFVALSQIFEGVGEAAYLGAAASITDKNVLNAAGSILTEESRHVAWIGSAVNKEQPWNSAFNTALDFDQAFSLASPFITSCPSTNPTLPIKAFPALSISDASFGPGSTVTLDFDNSSGDGKYLAVLYGLNPIFVAINDNKQVQLPSNIQGTAYVIVTKVNGTVTDDETVAGPAILNFPFDSMAPN